MSDSCPQCGGETREAEWWIKCCANEACGWEDSPTNCQHEIEFLQCEPCRAMADETGEL